MFVFVHVRVGIGVCVCVCVYTVLLIGIWTKRQLVSNHLILKVENGNITGEEWNFFANNITTNWFSYKLQFWLL